MRQPGYFQITHRVASATEPGAAGACRHGVLGRRARCSCRPGPMPALPGPEPAPPVGKCTPVRARRGQLSYALMMGTRSELASGAPSSAPPVTPRPAVRLSGVRKSYGTVLAADGIDLEVAEGEFFTMLGPSGSGKTTLLRVIAGFERSDDGSIELGGADVTRQPPYLRDVNRVFQVTVRQERPYLCRLRGLVESHIGGLGPLVSARLQSSYEIQQAGRFPRAVPGTLRQRYQHTGMGELVDGDVDR